MKALVLYVVHALHKHFITATMIFITILIHLQNFLTSDFSWTKYSLLHLSCYSLALQTAAYQTAFKTINTFGKYIVEPTLYFSQ